MSMLPRQAKSEAGSLGIPNETPTGVAAPRRQDSDDARTLSKAPAKTTYVAKPLGPARHGGIEGFEHDEGELRLYQRRGPFGILRRVVVYAAGTWQSVEVNEHGHCKVVRKDPT